MTRHHAVNIIKSVSQVKGWLIEMPSILNFLRLRWRKVLIHAAVAVFGSIKSKQFNKIKKWLQCFPGNGVFVGCLTVAAGPHSQASIPD